MKCYKTNLCKQHCQSGCVRRSEGWYVRRQLIAERSGGRCENQFLGRFRCTARATVVHHKSYDRFGDEPLADLEHLCRPCHKFRHWGGTNPARVLITWNDRTYWRGSPSVRTRISGPTTPRRPIPRVVSKRQKE